MVRVQPARPLGSFSGNRRGLEWNVTKWIFPCGIEQQRSGRIVFCGPLIVTPESAFSRKPSKLLDARHGAGDNSGERGSFFPAAILAQPLAGFFLRKPGSVAIGFLGRTEPGHFAQVHVDPARLQGPRERVIVGGAAAYIVCECSFFHASMHTRFFEGFQRSGLSMGQTGLSISLGKDPAAAAARLDQQELELFLADAIADGGDLFAVAKAAQVR